MSPFLSAASDARAALIRHLERKLGAEAVTVSTHDGRIDVPLSAWLDPLSNSEIAACLRADPTETFDRLATVRLAHLFAPSGGEERRRA